MRQKSGGCLAAISARQAQGEQDYRYREPIAEKMVEGTTAWKLREQQHRRRQQNFIMVPLWWADRLERATGQTYQVALTVLFEAWKAKGAPIKVGNDKAGSRQSKWRALTELERRGLIRIERRSKKVPLVHLVAR
jgi:hypothetical protein